MSKTSNIQVAFEQWKITETERIRNIQKQELAIIVEKIRKEWMGTSTKVQKSWNEKESQIENSFSQLQTVICEYENALSEKKNLETTIKDLEEELEQLSRPPPDDGKQERLSRINSLRLEIQKLEEDITEADTELRETTNSKNRYKRLYLQSIKSLKEMSEDKKRERIKKGNGIES